MKMQEPAVHLLAAGKRGAAAQGRPRVGPRSSRTTSEIQPAANSGTDLPRLGFPRARGGLTRGSGHPADRLVPSGLGDSIPVKCCI